MAVPYDRLRNLCGCHPYSIISCSFSFDDLISAVPHRVIDLIFFFFKIFVSLHLSKFFQTDPVNICAAPYSEFTVTVFSCDKRMHISAVHIQFLTDQILQPGGIKHCSGTYDPLLGKSWFLQRHLRQNVHRIGNDKKNSLAFHPLDLGNNHFHDLCIFVYQVQPCLTRFLVSSRGNDHHGCIRYVLISPGIDIHCMCKWQSVTDVHSLALCFRMIGVQQDHLRKHSFLHKRIRNSWTYKSASYHRCFLYIYHMCSPPFLAYLIPSVLLGIIHFFII